MKISIEELNAAIQDILDRAASSPTTADLNGILSQANSNISSAISDLIGSAPATLDNIEKLAAALQGLSTDDVAGLVALLDSKVDVSEVGNLPSLQTTDKSSIVNAINEVFTEVDSGKTLVGDAIEAKGVILPTDPTFNDLAQGVQSIQAGGYATGTANTTTSGGNTRFYVTGLGFTPTAVHIVYEGNRTILASNSPVNAVPLVVVSGSRVTSPNNVVVFDEGSFSFVIASSDNTGQFRYAVYA